jgi:hypothetical protein
MGRRLIPAIVLAVVLGGGLAHADPTPAEIQAARDLFDKAEKDEDAGQWAAALDKLRRASTVKPTPGIRFHIAQCEEKLGQLVPALADYTAADQAAREQNNKDVVDAVAEPLRALRIRVPTLTLDVPDAPNARVDLDGKTIAQGLYGVAMPVEPGTHRVQARATGRETFTTQVQLTEREAITTTIKWIPVKVDTTADPFAGGSNEAPKTEETPSSSVKWGAIVATASAVSLLAFGIGAYVAADGAASTLAQQCRVLADCSNLDRTTTRAWDWTALTMWVASAGLTVVAVVLWAQPSHKRASGTPARIELRPIGPGAALIGSF